MRVKKYVLLENDIIVNTSALIPHVEGYFIKDNHLISEQITGHTYDLGEIVFMSNTENELKLLCE